MAGKSKDRWWDESFNPVTGCTPISEGCRNCWAARMVKRFPQLHGADDCDHGCTTPHPRPFSKIKFHPPRLDQPLRWKRPRRIFVCSMGDLFHEDVKEEWIDHVIGKIYSAPRHTFMVLTKRPKRMCKYVRSRNCGTWPLPNLCLGVTVENQEMADLRIPILLQTPAAKRFVSVEPMLGEVDLTKTVRHYGPGEIAEGMAPLDVEIDTLRGRFDDGWDRGDAGAKLDWVIAGCESGPGRRPANPDWLRSLRDQCVAAGVPFFLKQMEINGKVVKMPELDGKVWDQVQG